MKRFERADGAYLTTALLLPACMLCARWSVWRVALGGIAAVVLLYCIAYLAERAPESFEMPRWYAAVRCVWCAAVLGYVAALTRGLFPQSNGSVVVPAVLLILAALACAKDAAVPARVGAVLWPFVLSMFAVVVVFALPDVQPARLREQGELQQSAFAIALLLLPGMRPVSRGRAKLPAFLLLALTVVLLPAVLCYGALGRAQTEALPFPLYAAAQSISVFGVMERFEVLLSAALAASAFCQMCFVLSAGAEELPGENELLRHLKFFALAFAGFGLMWFAPQVSPWVFAAGSAVFCGLIPLGILGIAAAKKSQKI